MIWASLILLLIEFYFTNHLNVKSIMKYNNFDQTDEEPFVESSYCIVISIEYTETRFCRETEPKWINFCKEHHFDNVKDAHGKIYEMYLVYCAEGLI